MGPNAQKISIDDFNADNFDHAGAGIHPRRADRGRTANLEGGPIGAAMHESAAGRAALGRGYRDFFAKYYARHVAIVGQTENLPMPIRPSISIPIYAMHGGCRRRA